MGLARISAGKALDVRHGTTVGTNTMLERKGARVAFVTTAGFEDTIAIGRQTRSKLYDWFVPLPICLVPRQLRFGVPERVSAEGEILRSPTEDELESLVNEIRGSGAEAVAISLLFSFANPETERRVEAAVGRLGVPISASHRILPSSASMSGHRPRLLMPISRPECKAICCIWNRASPATTAVPDFRGP